MNKNLVKFNENELKVFSEELLNEFQMMETLAGAAPKAGCSNETCPTNILCDVKFFCRCKSWLGCGGIEKPQ